MGAGGAASRNRVRCQLQHYLSRPRWSEANMGRGGDALAYMLADDLLVGVLRAQRAARGSEMRRASDPRWGLLAERCRRSSWESK